MTFINRLKTWFSGLIAGLGARHERLATRTDNANKELLRIEKEHARLGRSLYWAGVSGGPPQRMSLAQKGTNLRPNAFVELLTRVNRSVKMYEALPWWRRLFAPRPYGQDYRLVLYYGAKHYLDRGNSIQFWPQGAGPFSDYLLFLQSHRSGRKWHGCFSRYPVSPPVNSNRTQAESRPLTPPLNRLPEGDFSIQRRVTDVHELTEPLEPNQEMMKLKEQMIVAKKQALAAKAWADDTDTRCSAGKVKEIKSDELMIILIAVGWSVDSAEEAVYLAAVTIRRACCELEKGGDSQTLRLVDEIREIALEVIQAGQAAKEIGMEVSVDLTREARLRKEKARSEAEKARSEAEAARSKAQESGRQARLAQAAGVARLETSLLRLDALERELERNAGRAKVRRSSEPIALTHGDIFFLRLDLLHRAQRGGVFHLLYNSAVFRSSPGFSSIFNRNPRPEVSGCKEPVIEFTKGPSAG